MRNRIQRCDTRVTGGFGHPWLSRFRAACVAALAVTAFASEPGLQPRCHWMARGPRFDHGPELRASFDTWQHVVISKSKPARPGSTGVAFGLTLPQVRLLIECGFPQPKRQPACLLILLGSILGPTIKPSAFTANGSAGLHWLQCLFGDYVPVRPARQPGFSATRDSRSRRASQSRAVQAHRTPQRCRDLDAASRFRQVLECGPSAALAPTTRDPPPTPRLGAIHRGLPNQSRFTWPRTTDGSRDAEHPESPNR